jgi:hypothetical protein
MVAMKDYPDDAIPFYAQGFSLVEYLLERGRDIDDSEHRRLVRFAGSAMQSGDWKSALQEHYGIANLGELQTSWVAWVGAGSQSLPVVAAPVVAAVASVAPPILRGPVSVPVTQNSVAQSSVIQTNITQTSAKPLPPPMGLSVYDRQVETIPTKWNDEYPVSIPASFGRNVVLR